MLQSGTGSKELFRGPRQEVERSAEAYGPLLPQVSLEERLRLARNAYQTLMEVVGEMEGLVDTLLFQGRPQGQCSLCPGVMVVTRRNRSSGAPHR